MKIDKVIIHLPSTFNEGFGSGSENENVYSENENSQSETEDDDDEEYVEELNADEKKEIKKSVNELLREINSLQKLIDIGDYFIENNKYFIQCNICEKKDLFMYRISKINKPLKNLTNLIGMKSVKKTIFYQLMYFIQNLHDGKLDMLHTIIQGPPGVGKTELGKILCDLYSSLGVLKNKKYIIAKRSDLIGGYLGQTALKTQAVIDKAKGGVLFIDEAYSLGDSGDKKDSFSKECIDTLNLNLTENKHQMMCIIAGYKDCLERSFFSQNEGLKRRFNFCMNIEKYDYTELQQIFLSKIKDGEWKIKEPLVKHCPIKFFRENVKYFPFFGGDIENFIFCIKMEHSMNLLQKKRKKKILTIEDLEKGFEMYKINNNRNPEEENTSFMKMYI